MNDIAIIFIYTDKNELTKINLKSLQDNNANIPIFDICQQDFTDCHYQFLDIKPIKYWTPSDIWYWGSDNIFIHWYLSNKFRAKNYLIIEGDTYTKDMSVYDFFGSEEIENNTGLKCVTLNTFNDNPNYYWFKEQINNQFIDKVYTKNNFKSCMPLCGTLISDNCIDKILQHISENYFANKLFVETKFGTIASYLGFSVEQYKRPIGNFIDFNENTIIKTIDNLANVGQLRGIFHPIKNISIIENIIKHQEINHVLPEIKINKAFYGKLVDVKNAIEKLHNIIPQEKIQINNFLAGDPAHGVAKELYLMYEKNNQIFEIVIPENEFLDYSVL